MPETEVILRLPHQSISNQDREFFGLSQDQFIDVIWPEECALTGNEAKKKIPALAEKKRTFLRFMVPVSDKTAELAKRDFSWIGTAGLWLSYVGILGFFVILFFKFALSNTAAAEDLNLFFWSMACAVVAFGGFYFVRLMRWLWPGYGRWATIPGVQTKILNAKPYFVDVRFRFFRGEYARLFAEQNQHLLKDKLEKWMQQQVSGLETSLHKGTAGDYLKAGMARERIGDSEKAIEYYEKALAHDSSLHVARKHRGANLLWLNRLNLAEKSLDAYLENKPDDVEAILLLASVYELRKQTQMAQQLYQQALRLSDDVTILERSGDLAFHSGDFSLAAGQFGNAVKKAKESFLLHAKWLESLQRSGDKSGLASALKIAVGNLPDRRDDFVHRYGG